MEKIFHWSSTFKNLGETDDGGLDIKGSASTNSLDRAGDIINADAWTKGGLDNFKNNPVILFNHNYDKPIGRAKDLGVTENGLDITARISKSVAKLKILLKTVSLELFLLVSKSRTLNIKETDGYKIKDAELFEVSVVSVPCNQTAVFSLAKSFDNMEDYDKFKRQFIKETSSTESADAVKIEQPSQAKKAEVTETTICQK